MFITEPHRWLEALPPHLRGGGSGKLRAAAAGMQRSASALYKTAGSLRDQDGKREEARNHQRAAAAAASIARGWSELSDLLQAAESEGGPHPLSPMPP